MTKISAEVVADSTNEFGNRLTTMVCTFPRFILAELNTHRMFSRNSASSRAIPFKKMVETVKNDPFIPIAWQKDHKGMQGAEYLDNVKGNQIDEDFNDTFTGKELFESIWATTSGCQIERPDGTALYHMADIATELNRYGVTKQLANRLLEPFMWHTAIISATEWENFFALRCPQYVINVGGGNDSEDDVVARSWKDLMANPYTGDFATDNIVERLSYNKGQAEIHMMALAEAMWDAMNESTPKQLVSGQWHIPYEDKINISDEEILEYNKDTSLGQIEARLKMEVAISTAMCARASYTTVGDEKEVSYERLIGIYDKMATANPFHASPFEHCSTAMNSEELDNYIRIEDGIVESGWCRNFRGFVQLRAALEHERRLP